MAAAVAPSIDAKAVEATDLRVTLGGAEIVHGVSLEVSRGEWLGVVGPNGAGKSTIIRAIAGLVPHSGHLSIEGTSTRELRARRIAQLVAMVPQTPVIPVAMTVAEYVMLGRTPHLSYFGREGAHDRHRTQEVLERLALVSFAERALGSLSGGERQRAVIARALNQDAPILLLDEPTSALDVGHQQEVLELVEHLRHEDGLAVVSAMHDLSHAGQYPDRVMLLVDGRVVADGSPEEVLTAAAIFDHYGASVRVTPEPHGGVAVTPSRAVRRQPEAVRAKPPDPALAVFPPLRPPVREGRAEASSLVILNTGYGKGKSTAAFGMMMRAIARGWRVTVIQFLKSGKWKVGEEKIARDLGVEWWSLGTGFTWDSEDIAEARANTAAAWAAAKTAIASGEHDFIVLDELTYAVSWGWIPEEEIVEALRARPAHVNVVITGRDATDGLVEIADTATEMAKIKHAYDRGVPARRGIDF